MKRPWDTWMGERGLEGWSDKEGIKAAGWEGESDMWVWPPAQRWRDGGDDMYEVRWQESGLIEIFPPLVVVVVVVIYNWVIFHGSPFVKPWHNPTSNSISFWRVFTPAIGGAGFADFNSQIQPQPPPPLQQCIIQGETLQDKNYLIFWQKCNDNHVKMKKMGQFLTNFNERIVLR